MERFCLFRRQNSSFSCQDRACGRVATAYSGYDPYHSHSAVDSAIYRIQLDHNLVGIPSPTDSPIIHDVSRAAKRLIGTRLINKIDPILPDNIKLVEASKLNNLLYLRNVCIFLLAFAGFFRIEEVLYFKFGDITFHGTYVATKVD